MFQKIYQIVKKIPPGKVATYGDISLAVTSELGVPTKRLSRVVGYALHDNPDPSTIPCHRVVNKEGRLAPGFAFGGEEIQKERLLKEGVAFKDQNHVDMQASHWRPVDTYTLKEYAL